MKKILPGVLTILLLLLYTDGQGKNLLQDNRRAGAIRQGNSRTDAVRYRQYADKTLETLQKWYNEDTGQWKTTNWWNAANALTAIIDYSRITGTKEYLDVIENTFEKCKEFEVKSEDPSKNWTCRNFINDYYDDEGWWVLAWIDAYDLTGKAKYLDMARVTFSDMTKGWDEVCGGGIYWKKPDVAKSAVQNELFMLCAIRLHQRSPGTENGFTYLEWARRTWKWFENTGMINEHFQIENGLKKNCELDAGRRYTYNQAMILSALFELGREDNDPRLLQIANKIAHAAITTSIYEDGILKDPSEPRMGADGPQFKGIFMRHLAYLYSVTHDPDYKDFINKNAGTIWNKARNGSTNEIGGIWKGPFDQADASRQSCALDAFNAALIVNDTKQ